MAGGVGKTSPAFFPMNAQENAEKILGATGQVKELTLNHIVRHLLEAQNDTRPRERVRAGIALANIKKWSEIYKNEQEKNNED
jgi:hypothetical protein